MAGFAPPFVRYPAGACLLARAVATLPGGPRLSDHPGIGVLAHVLPPGAGDAAGARDGTTVDVPDKAVNRGRPFRRGRLTALDRGGHAACPWLGRRGRTGRRKRQLCG